MSDHLSSEGTSTISIWTQATGLQVIARKDIGISTPEDLVADANGTLFFTDDKSGGVWAVNREGRGSLLAGRDKGLGSTEGIALSPSGHILVGDPEGHRVLRVDRGGDVSVFLGPEHKISKPESMAYDGEGNLFIADNSDDILYMRTPVMVCIKPSGTSTAFRQRRFGLPMEFSTSRTARTVNCSATPRRPG